MSFGSSDLGPRRLRLWWLQLETVERASPIPDTQIAADREPIRSLSREKLELIWVYTC